MQEINGNELDLDYDVVFIYDPQPAGLIIFRKKGKWVCRCHIDISNPYHPVWDFLREYIQKYNSVIVSLAVFARDDLKNPQFIIPPWITAKRILYKFDLDPDRPIITQLSRFDRAKDPLGVIRAYKLVKKHAEIQLSYEGEIVYKETIQAAGDDKCIKLLMPTS